MSLSRRERRDQRKKLLKDQRLHQLKAAEEQEAQADAKSEYKGLLRIYEKHYLKLLVIPVLIFLLSIGVIINQVATTGDFMNRGVSLKGGMVITVLVYEPVSISELDELLKARFPGDDVEVRSIAEFGAQKAVMITTDNLDAEKDILDAITPFIPNAKQDSSAETTGSSLGSGFFKQTMIAVLIAFLAMSVVVLVSFRNLIPSIMVIFCVFANIVETLALVNLLGIKISTAGIAAFMMLIGYSIDTDVLLTSRVLRGKEGTVFQRVLGAAKTGLLMTLTAITAVTIGLIMSSSNTIKEIMTIILLGLVFDIINTWIQNAALLRHFVERKMGKKAKHAKHAEPEDDTGLLEAEEEADGSLSSEQEDDRVSAGAVPGKIA